MRAGDGNESDKAMFAQILLEFKNQIKFDSILVADSALYSQENLKLMEKIKWITRVPLTLKKARELSQSVEIEKNKPGKDIEVEAGRFILATNILDEVEIKPAEILENYKNQQGCERGFGFLKDPLFFADSFFVEKPQRVETILFLMSLCLLVYNLGQRELRKSLKRAKTGVKNQVGKLTDSPTLRWIFQCFQGIHFVFFQGIKQVVNLTEERRLTLRFLPKACEKYYLLSG